MNRSKIAATYPALNDDVPQDRWAGLRTRDDMRAEVNGGRPTNSRLA